VISPVSRFTTPGAARDRRSRLDKSQHWWRGSDADDLDELMREFSAASYPVDRVTHAVCSNCDAAVFDVVLSR